MRDSGEDVFKYCLENPDNLTEEQLLEKFPQHSEELRSALRLHSQLSRNYRSQMSPEAHDTVLKRVLAAAEQSSSAQAPKRNTPVGDTERTRVLPAKRGIGTWAVRSMWAVAILAVVIGTVWMLAAQSLPDSPVYGVKLATEDLLLGAASDNPSRVRGHIGIANTRLVDMQAMNAKGNLAAAEPSLDNYSRHLKSGVTAWHNLTAGSYPDLDKFLYASSVAGQRTFQGFDAILDTLPQSLKSNIIQTERDLTSLIDETSGKLRSAGIDLKQALRDAGGTLAALLTPSASALPTPALTAVVATPTVAATLDVVSVQQRALEAAQEVIARGGSAATPIVAAAETVVANVPGTSLAIAQQTVLSNTPGVAPSVTPLATASP